MHPYSPHAPSHAARHSGLKVIGDPLDALATDIRSKVSASGSKARAHVAAEELKIRRPRRPAARRAAFRTPPASN